MKLIRLLFFLLFPALALAQGNSNYSNIIFSSTGKPLAGAYVTVCSSGAVGIPCSPSVNIFDQNGAPIANPIRTDSLGNFSFWAASGIYTYTVTGNGVVATGPFTIVLPCISGQACGTSSQFPWIQLNSTSTPILNVGNGNVSYGMAINSNITSVTLAGTPQNGNYLAIKFQQDNIGGHTISTGVFPANVLFPVGFSFNTAASSAYWLSWTYDSFNGDWEPMPVWGGTGAGTSFYQTVQNNGTALPKEPILNCTGLASCFDDPGNNRTNIGVPAQNYGVILNNAVALPVEPALNAVPPLVATDNGANSRTDLSLPNFVGAGGSAASGAVPSPGAVVHNWPLCDTGGFAATCQGSSSGLLPNPVLSASLFAAPPWQLNVDTSFGGPNPYIDARTYGVRAVNAAVAPAVPGITANMTSGVNTATISSASTFQNGDGVVIWGAGATNAMSTPAAPTVVPSIAAALTGSLLDVASPAGAVSYSYQVVARDRNGGLTAASTATTGSTGQTLGAQSASISAITLTNNIVTVTATNTLSAGAMVVIEGVTATGGQNPFNGWFTVATATGSSFTYSTMSDSRNGAATTGASGNAHWWNSNHITWTAVTGAFQYYIYGRTGGSMGLIGVSWPQNSTFAGDRTYLAFDDFGSTITVAPTPPAYVPSTPPVSATNDMLITTIASGAGTTTLTLADVAGNNASGATILFDDGATLSTAATAASNTSGSASGTLYLPWADLTYVINSPVTLPTSLSIIQNSDVLLNETMIAEGVTWAGAYRPNGSSLQFSIARTQNIAIGKSYPGFYAPGSTSMHFSYVTLSSNFNSNVLMLRDGGSIPSDNFDNVQFGLPNDHSTIAVVVRGTRDGVHSGSGMFFRYVVFSGPQNTLYSDSTPAVYFDEFGQATFDHAMFSGKGVFDRPSTAGGNIEANAFNYTQGAYMPLFSFINADGGNIGLGVKLENVTMDTTLQPTFANLGGMTINATLENVVGAGGPTVTGSPSTFVNFIGGDIQNPGINTSYELQKSSTVADGTFGLTTIGVKSLNASMKLGAGYSLFTASSPSAAPSCSVNSGGSVPIGSITYAIVPVWANGSEGVASGSCSVTTSGGNQTVGVTWAAVTGAIGYDVYRSGVLTNFGGCTIPQTTGTTLTDTSSFGCGPSQPAIASGGPAGIHGGNVWGNTANIGQYIDFAGLGSAPSNPSAGYCRTYYDSVAGTTKGINSTGASCSPTGGGGGSGTVNNGAQFAMPYYSAAGSSNFISGVVAPASPNSVPNFWVTIPSAGLATAPQAILAGIPGRSVSGASDTILATDRVSEVTYTNAGATAISLPGAGTTGFASNFCFKMIVQGSSAVATITPASGTINGGATQAVLQGQKALVCSFDNSNYIATISDPPAAAGANIALTRGDTSLSFASTAGGGTVTHTAGALTAGQLMTGNGSADATVGDISGDCTTSGSTAITCTKLNGTAFSGTNGNLVKFGAANVPADSSVVAANVITSTGSLASGNVVNGASPKTVTDSGIASANLVTAASNAGFANQLCASGGANKACAFTSLADISATDYMTTSGSVNVLAGCPTDTAAALTTGMKVKFLPNLANTTTTPTFNLCTKGAKTITKAPGVSALVANDLVTTAIADVVYDGTEWQLQNPQTSSGGGGSTAISSLTAAAASNTIANGDYAQLWNSALTTNGSAGALHSSITAGETSAALNGTVTTNLSNQAILEAVTTSGSTATPLAVQQGPVTSTVAFPALQISTTWNNAALTAQGIVLAVTNTASLGGSKLINLLAGASGTTSQFSVDENGVVTTIGGLRSHANYLADTSTTSLIYQGGQDSLSAGNTNGSATFRGANNTSTTASSAAGAATLNGGDETAGGGNALIGGNTIVRGGNLTNATGTASTAGNVTVQGGDCRLVTSASVCPGKVKVLQVYFNTGTTNVNDLACVTAANTVASCAAGGGVSLNMFIGVIDSVQNSDVLVASIGAGGTHTFNATSATFTNGHFVCQDSTNGNLVVDSATVCTAGQGVGMYIGATGTTTTPLVAMRPY